MTKLTEYLLMRLIDIASLIVILRACYFLFLKRADPIKSVRPKFVENWFEIEANKQHLGEITKDLG